MENPLADESTRRFVYLIFSHDHQHQLARLANAIGQLSPHALVVIHHDPNDGALDHKLFSQCRNVHFVPNPIHGEWGSFSLVAQYLHSLRFCLDNFDWAWICALTGLTYPIAPLEPFENRLLDSTYDAYARHFDPFAADPWPSGTGLTRYCFSYYELPRLPYYYKIPQTIREYLTQLRKAFNAKQPFLRIVPMPRGARSRIGIRRLRLPIPPGFKLAGGRQTINLNRTACKHIFRFIDANPWYIPYFQTVLIPDEGFFNSIVINDSTLRVCNDELRFIKWPQPKGASSVAVITASEIDAVLKSGAPFALKLNEDEDPEALDAIDRALGITDTV